MIFYEKVETISQVNNLILQHVCRIDELGFHVLSKAIWNAYPFEAANHFLEIDIDKLIALFETNHKIKGGIFNEEFNLFLIFSCELNKENLVELNENYSNCKLFFYDLTTNWILFFSSIEYGIFFSNAALSFRFLRLHEEDVLRRFNEFTEGWPENWNMNFLELVSQNCSHFNLHKEDWVNFLPTRFIKIT